ncbi:small GTP-binding protein [Salibacterium salarium]|uniref:dynamin family protein n=1 Tax=Salibacterium salarium TaxID=284579 RepID=UPI00278AE6B3|nr:dynamin family protein [Salibacterium salarium]MDQ0299400.1 small GTP-binding protein [Salibacterium salarium]
MPEVQTKKTSSLRDLPFYPEDEKRLRALEEKKKHPYFEIAFCGHFSAGKSTLLNRLLENELLPTSPIPTSANIISILYGDTTLELVDKEGERQTWAEEIPWNKVREWGMDGVGIQSISIYAPLPFISSQTKIMDTPGVDSTDPNHQLVTAEQLYTTDVIVYVTDYNHVQSETNVRFLKQMADEEKPIILVINQIDKHDDKELSHASFENALQVMLARNGIKPFQMFFTSMKEENHPLNQFKSFQSKLKSIMYNSDSLRAEGVPLLENGSVHRLIERLQDEKQEAYEEWRNDVIEKGLSPEDAKDNEKQEQQLNNIETEEQEQIKALYQERNQLFKNVNVFPYTTTEKAGFWLDSKRKNFKVGLLFTKQKTAEEQRKRLKSLLEELNEKVKTQLIFHLKKLLSSVDKESLNNPKQYDERVQQLSFTVDEQMLQSFAPASEFDRNFVYTFTDQVTSAIVRRVKADSNHLFQEYEQAIKNQINNKTNNLRNKMTHSSEVKKEWERWESIAANFDKTIETCQQWLQDRKYSSSFFESLRTVSEQGYPNEEAPVIYITDTDDSIIGTEEISYVSESFTEVDDSFIYHLRQYLTEYSNRPLLSEEKEKLGELLDQFDNNTAIVSLFGAFSAGKSSFINAMLGDDILPVSPHPTTSAVNKIRKSNDTYSHGTALIQIKEEEFLNDEIKTVSRELGKDLDIQSLEKWKKPSLANMTDYQRTYASYLYTLQQSIKKNIATPNSQIEVPLEKLEEWVAEEEKACLIKEVIVHYNCSWTLAGLELVDTPGVNSIHGRHTNVAFDHLRQSDAILYVTYYNHAFSKADQVFLTQMARANEQFETDKLFFIINASDLATDKRELQGVKNHVQDQLIQNGVQEPRLFALSSKSGLNVKQTSATSEEGEAFRSFEKYFSHTIMDELKAVHVKKMKAYWNQMNKQLGAVISSFKNKEENVTQHLEDRHALADQFLHRSKEFDLSFLSPLLKEELEQQCTYLKDRTRYIVQDYFSQAVNPTVITASTKNKQKDQLKGALQELEGLARTYIFQEEETIIIRLEERMKKEFSRYIRDFLLKRKPDSIPMLEPQQNIQFNDKIEKNVDMVLDQEYFSSFYHSGKDFFENKKVQTLKEAFADDVQRKAGEVVEPFKTQVEHYLISYLQELTSSTKVHLANEVEKDKSKANWMFDISKKEEIKEEYDYIQASL